MLILPVLGVTVESHHEGEKDESDNDIELAGEDPLPGVLVMVAELAGNVTDTDETSVTVAVVEAGLVGRTP
ncbi:hypothetical protein PG999_000497 [Apiospora kogelbergensis]|uniref:Uncharacterized protein n=1 Tax=Apiospora kogelbergensis TaxID=1337665 RepID=A0AAW0RC24_9PEZI